MAAMEAANAHYTNGSHQQSGLPASPTLTNPDMILPDYDRSDSPEPDLGPSADHALMMWKNSQAANLPPDMHHMFVATGLAGPRPYGPAGPITPTTPIIYGNGTMLSDIGEVTEVESVVEKPSPPPPKPSLRKPSSPKLLRGGEETALGSSPTIGAVPAAKKRGKSGLAAKHERRLSMESTSTITMENNGATAVPDIDDSVSVGDSVFQGDDEQSMASSYVEGTPAVEPARLGVPRTENFDRLSIYSATSLSRRAEEILANAKRRLTTMEGNLSRARSNLHYSTSSYGSDETSTPSPPFQRLPVAAHEAHDFLGPGLTAEYNPGHARMSSDLGMRNGSPYLAPTPRSQSALGAAGGYRQPLTASRSVDYLRGDVSGSARSSLYAGSSARDPNVKPLTEDEVARLGEADSETQNARLEAFLSPTFGSFQESTPRNSLRSPSAAQMRDIKEQMKDLKGKISSLREQARRDSMKRRSLQSLRTPSPFTHAQVDQWHVEPSSRRTSALMTGQLPERNPWNGEEESVDGDVQDAMRALTGDEETDYADAEEGIPSERELNQLPELETQVPEPAVEDAPGPEDDVSDMQTENGDVEEDQISHEDREDAFDYEHFFLHSALGTMSLSRRRSTESLTSNDSVETTRGPLTTTTTVGGYTVVQPRAIPRRNSSNSISTIDTFATAQEARSLKSPVGDEASHDPSSRAASAQSRHRPTASASKRHSYTSLHPTRDNSDGSISPIAEESSTAGSPARRGHPVTNPQTTSSSSCSSRRASVIHRPLSATLHRPSVSSFDSVGTNRSFPLVNKPASRPATVAGTAPTNRHAHSTKASTVGALTPGASSPEADVTAVASRLMSDMGREVRRLQRGQNAEGGEVEGEEVEEDEAAPHPLEALLREDKYLVERLVASLGKCVLGLTENGRAGSESRMYRRRLDAARRVLEGLDAPEV
ncbi:hypothetical protein VTJ49DRAFT_1064 [Mycothermus thermophilus]|uniref:Cep57 centrosome microtubule-binding domain-containing protein n=1 Tax=Humicola insolens TaxID=85995 RepID=A0ABR3VDQ9_HUMIN